MSIGTVACATSVAPRVVFDQMKSPLVTWEIAAEKYAALIERRAQDQIPHSAPKINTESRRHQDIPKSGWFQRVRSDQDVRGQPHLAIQMRNNFKLLMALRHFVTWNCFIEKVNLISGGQYAAISCFIQSFTASAPLVRLLLELFGLRILDLL